MLPLCRALRVRASQASPALIARQKPVERPPSGDGTVGYGLESGRNVELRSRRTLLEVRRLTARVERLADPAGWESVGTIMTTESSPANRMTGLPLSRLSAYGRFTGTGSGDAACGTLRNCLIRVLDGTRVAGGLCEKSVDSVAPLSLRRRHGLFHRAARRLFRDTALAPESPCHRPYQSYQEPI